MQYTNNKTKIRIICPTHGEFLQTPTTHINNKSGCKKCASETYSGAYHKHDTKWFIETAKSIHGDKYDYNKVEYVRYHSKVEIVCPEHGSFFQSTTGHIHQRQGCPACSVKDYEGGYGTKRFSTHPEIKNNPARLYVIRAFNDTEMFVKIGITQKAIDERFKQNRLFYQYEVLYEIEGQLYDLFLLEQQVKKDMKTNKYRPSVKFNGHTECFHATCASEIINKLNNI